MLSISVKKESLCRFAGGYGVIRIYDYLFISPCEYEINKKAINEIKGSVLIRANLIFITYLKN